MSARRLLHTATLALLALVALAAGCGPSPQPQVEPVSTVETGETRTANVEVPPKIVDVGSREERAANVEVPPELHDVGGAQGEDANDEPAEVAHPARLRVPAIGVDAPLTHVGLNPDRSMETPPLGSGVAGWYDRGPKPGEPGPAVLVGHINSAAYGPDVFARLVEIAPGDEIHVDLADGSTVTFEATSNERTPKDYLPTERIWSGDDEPVLRLITCGGRFDPNVGSHLDNDIVYAKHVDA